MSKITELVWQMAEPVAQRNGCTVWDVEFIKEAGERFLRVYIDSDNGVDITQCEAVSRELDPMLDEADPIEGSYNLEVSSPGVERTLTRPEHFEMMKGQKVTARCFTAINGNRIFTGTLLEADGEKITIETEAGIVELPRKAVSKTETVYDW